MLMKTLLSLPGIKNLMGIVLVLLGIVLLLLGIVLLLLGIVLLPLGGAPPLGDLRQSASPHSAS